jgi:hypothetical protein
VLDIHTLFIIKKKPVTKELALRFVYFYYKLLVVELVGADITTPLLARFV